MWFSVKTFSSILSTARKNQERKEDFSPPKGRSRWPTSQVEEREEAKDHVLVTICIFKV